MIRDRNLFRQEYKHAQGWWEDSFNVKQISRTNLSWNTSYGAWEFGNVSNRTIDVIIQFPHGKIMDTAVGFHLHWMPTTVSTATVDWVLEWFWKNAVGDTAQGAFGAGTTETINATPNGTAYVLQLDSFTDLTPPMAAETVSSILTIRLYRDGANDTNNDVVLLKDFDAHLRLDQPGSYGEASKWGA